MKVCDVLKDARCADTARAAQKALDVAHAEIVNAAERLTCADLLERMRGNAEPVAWRTPYKVGDGDWVWTTNEARALDWVSRGDVVECLYEHPPAAPAQPAERPIQVGDRVRCKLQGETGTVTAVTTDTTIVRVSDGMVVCTAPHNTPNWLERVDD